jgi:hypothetical protein
MYYLYQHISKKTGDVFYVGIGDSSRPYDTKGRSNFWNYVHTKHGHDVEIVKSFESWDEACEWEKFFISIYGRRDLKTGRLVNMTGGGEGAYNISKELSEQKRKKILSKIGRVYDVYKIDTKEFVGKFYGTKDAAEVIGCDQQSIGSVANQNRLSVKGHFICHDGSIPVWSVIDNRYGHVGRQRAGKMSRLKSVKNNKIPVYQYDKNGKFISRYDSGAEAGRLLGINRDKIYQAAKGSLKTAFGFVWKYD